MDKLQMTNVIYIISFVDMKVTNYYILDKGIFTTFSKLVIHLQHEAIVTY